MKYRTCVSSLLFLCFFLSPVTNAAESKAVPQPQGERAGQASAEQKWGIRPLGIHLTANNYMLDFRYRVLDADKAAPLINPQVKPYLIDQSTGAKFFVPESQKVGALRQTRKPASNRNYFIIFGNPGKFIKRGSRITVVIGDFKAEDLVVE